MEIPSSEAAKSSIIRCDNKVIHYTGGESLGDAFPNREYIVAKIDSGTDAMWRSKINKKEPLYFMPTDIREVNEYSFGVGQYRLQLFGVIPSGLKVEVIIKGISPSFEIEIPDKKVSEQVKEILEFYNAEAHNGGAHRGEAHNGDTFKIDSSRMRALPLMGYKEKESRFIRFSFNNLKQYKEVLSLVRGDVKLERGKLTPDSFNDAPDGDDCSSKASTERKITKDRMIAFLIKFPGLKLNTYSDDISSYYRKVARENGWPLSDWAIITDYKTKTADDTVCSFRFIIDKDSYKPLTNTREKAADPLLSKDRTMVLTWDIETYTGRQNGDLPRGQHKDDHCFMICGSAHWKDDPKPLTTFCITDVEVEHDPEWITIQCNRGGYDNIIRAFALCFRAIAPDIVVGFNDSDYDWPFIVDKALLHFPSLLGWMFNKMTASPGTYITEDIQSAKEITDESVNKWNYVKDKRIKISPEDSLISKFLKVPGCLAIDVRVCFKKLFPKDGTPKSGSLKYYLSVCRLESKEDMPIHTMWKHYADARETAVPASQVDAAAACLGTTTAQNMRLVARYCVIDAIRCQELLVKRTVISDYREVSTLAFVSLADSHFYAGGMKVKNLVAAYANKRGILVAMATPSERIDGKYPGAYVFPPEKGLGPDPIKRLELESAAAEWRESVGLTAATRDAAANPAAIDAFTVAKMANGVFPPKIQAALDNFEKERPVTGLDFSSLYPSLIMTYNFSPEKFIADEETARKYKEAGKNIHHVDFMFGPNRIVGWFVGHENKPEDMGLFPDILIDLFDKRAQMKVEMSEHAHTIETIDQIYGNPDKDVVKVAKMLYQKAKDDIIRIKAIIESGNITLSPGSTPEEEMNDLKRLLKVANTTIKVYERLFDGVSAGDAAGDMPCNISAHIIAKIYSDAKFAYMSANAKQNALKVYMNTFYGEAGNSISALFLLQLAGGVTSYGQKNIKFVAEHVKKQGFHIKYGDTDSLYLIAPSKYFSECDMHFVLGNYDREQWMSAMIRITMRALNQIRDEVNTELFMDNGSKYLKMAYEEVLYPFLFTGKKKYLGIPHLNEVNLNGSLFIRGIDIVKQGQSGLAVDIGTRIMKECMKVSNDKTVHQIVIDTLKNAIDDVEQWDISRFNMTAAYKPNKKNVSVITFYDRMVRLHAAELAEHDRAIKQGRQPPPILYTPPEAGERFSYVIVKQPVQFNLRGCKITPKKGEIMEFSRNVEPLGLKIDIGEYLIKFVIGICARFINSSEQFKPDNTLSGEKIIDEKSQANAKKFLEDQIRIFRGEDPTVIKKLGLQYRKEFRNITKISKIALTNVIGDENSHIFHGKLLNMELFLSEETTADILNVINDRIVQHIERLHDASIIDHACKLLIDYNPKGLYEMSAVRKPNFKNGRCVQPAYVSVLKCFKGEEDITRAAIARLIPEIVDITKRYKSDIERLLQMRREDSVSDAICDSAADRAGATDTTIPTISVITPEDRIIIDEFRELWYRLLSIQSAEFKYRKISEELVARRNKNEIHLSPADLAAERIKITEALTRSGIDVL